MKRTLAAALLLLWLCGSAALGEGVRYQDGVYRGFYYQDAMEQVAVQFELKDGLFKSVVLRNISDRQGSLLDEDASEQRKDKLEHFTILCDHLVGKPVSAIDELYSPEKILRAAGHTPINHVPYEKLISALWNGVSRRPYKLVDTSKLPEAAPYLDGLYTGTYSDDDGEQVILEFIVSENIILQIGYRKLAYKGVDYLDTNASQEVQQVALQFQALIDYLVDKPISAINDLYLPGEIAADTDVSSAATLRAPKIISAIWEGLNKNEYTVD